MASKAQTLQKVIDNLPDNPAVKVRTEKHREVENTIIEYATNCIKPTTISAGITITDSRMLGRDVGCIIIDDLTKNKGFNKPTSGTTITLNDGTTLSGNEVVTIIML